MPRLPRIVIDARMVGGAPYALSRYVTCLARGLSRLTEEAPLRYEPLFLVSPSMDVSVFGGFGTIRVGARWNCFFEKIEIGLIAKRLGAAQYSSRDLFKHLTSPVIDLQLLERAPPNESAQLLQNYGLGVQRYFLCLSSLKPRKNLKKLLGAYLKYANSLQDQVWPLVLNLTESELHAILPQKDNRILALGGFNELTLRTVMQNAGAMIVPSLEGGVGMTAVEAASMGVPLVASRTSAYRKVLGELFQGEVLWVLPESEDLWIKALKTASSGSGMLLGASMESRSLLLKKYSASRLGVELNQIYCEMLGLEK